MKAVWAGQLPRKTAMEQWELAEFAGRVGFDTLVVPAPTEVMVDRAHELGLKVLSIVSPRTNVEFSSAHPECVQRMLPVEHEMADILTRTPSPDYQKSTFRWFPVFQPTELLCYEHERSVTALKDRVGNALRSADGIAFDGFGFRNHYACFCERCDRGRSATGSEVSLELLQRWSEWTLIKISHTLYDHAKTVNPGALVINHVWPPFRPNPYYGCKLRLDYCSQTISWFYRPTWSLERVEFEAREHKRLEDPQTNTFVPFIALHDTPEQLRSPTRIRKEFAIAKRYGNGHLVFGTLKSLKAHDAIRDVVQEALG